VHVGDGAALYELAAIAIAGVAGATLAWLMRRRTTLSIRNLYLPAAIAAGAILGALASGRLVLAAILAPLSTPAVAGSLLGRRWRLHDLGAGKELRQHELGRRWISQPPPARQPRERVFIGPQGELVHRRPWTASVPRIAMGQSDDERLACRWARASTCSSPAPRARARRRRRDGCWRRGRSASTPRCSCSTRRATSTTSSSCAGSPPPRARRLC
jgi:hypothetical protein